MKIFNFTLTLIVLLICKTSLTAQILPVSFGIKAGVNLATSSIDMGDFYNKSSKVGFNVGVTAEYRLIESFYIESGLSLTTKGPKLKGADMWIGGSLDSYTIWKQNVNQMYLQLPVLAAYKINIVPGIKLLVHAGPYFAYGIGGKADIKYNYTGGASGEPKTKLDTFDKDHGLKKFDMGLLGGVGAEFGKLVFTLDYELGLSDLSRKDFSNITYLLWDDNVSYKNRNASLSLGYKF